MPTAISYSDKILFQKIASGDVEAFREIFDLYKKRLFAIAIKLSKSQLVSEEITQEVFISLWVSRALLIKVEDPGAYIFRILYNKLNSYLRKESNHSRLIKDAVQFKNFYNNNTEEAVDVNETMRRINEAVEKLPPQQKAVYRLSRQKGMKNDEIAAELKISPNTVKTHLSKALEAIRTHLDDVAFVTSLLACFNEYSHLLK
ncbi:MAG TPA: RNA polymerase sigma-70 factor [Ginsengibacter sp.]